MKPISSPIPKVPALALLCLFTLTACGGSSIDSAQSIDGGAEVSLPGTAGPGASTPETPDPTPPETPPGEAVNSVRVYDANNTPLADAQIGLIQSDAQAQPQMLTMQSAQLQNSDGDFPAPDAFSFDYVTDSDGYFSADLGAGAWYALVEKNGTHTYLMFTVDEDNQSNVSIFATALSCDQENNCLDVSDQALVGSLTGTVVTDAGPAANAQVSLSGGSATNGIFASTTTDENGQYQLFYNVNNQLAGDLQSATLIIDAEGQAPYSQTMPIKGESYAGQNAVLSAGGDQIVYWQEDFEADSATANQWTTDGGTAQTGWQLLTNGHNITNDLVNVQVQLAPDDDSNGRLPNSYQGEFAYWYGDGAQGNFVGELGSTEAMSGGTSTNSHSGTLTSPMIDLSNVPDNTDIALSFRTWWEIESVNPNADGFDIMAIEVSVDGESFTPLARLNPLSDPQTPGVNRDPIPYSNQGYNTAPGWHRPQAIPLTDFAGESSVYLRFNFQTVDHLYNGFRGWLIDDIVIREGIGTLPPPSGF